VLEPFLAEYSAYPTPQPFTVHQVFSVDGFLWEQGSNRVLRKGEWRTKDNFAFCLEKVFNVYAKSLNM
jgi:hypothetical protein